MYLQSGKENNCVSVLSNLTEVWKKEEYLSSAEFKISSLAPIKKVNNFTGAVSHI